MAFRIAMVEILLVMLYAGLGPSALAADNYQTDIGPTPLNGTNRADILGRGTAHATLDGSKFTLHGTFSGLATPATEAHLCMGNIMGGTGPIIYDVTVSQAQSGTVSGIVQLTPEQVAALKTGKIYLLLDSQKAPKGNLWGWFQPAHKTVGPDVPQEGKWYLPSILNDESNTGKKKVEG